MTAATVYAVVGVTVASFLVGFGFGCNYSRGGIVSTESKGPDLEKLKKLSEGAEIRSRIARANSAQAGNRTKIAHTVLKEKTLPEPFHPNPRSPQGAERAAMLDLISKQQYEIETLRVEVREITAEALSWKNMALFQESRSRTLQIELNSKLDKEKLLRWKIGGVSFSVGFGAGLISGALIASR